MAKLDLVHLTDLHVGQKGKESNFKHAVSLFKKDIAKLAKREQLSPKVVMITGDLVFSGKKKEFVALQKELDELWKFFNSQLKCKPYLVTVPGNHDLDRPKKNIAQVISLKDSYFGNEDLFNAVWTKDSEFEGFFRNRFAGYENWRERSKLLFPPGIKIGWLPGDFSVKLSLGGINLGIIGLNSSFLHITNGSYENLDMNEKQLHTVCKNKVDAWCEKNDFNLLLSHHGDDWLHPIAKENFESHIYPNGRFEIHLFGHVHESLAVYKGGYGEGPRRYLQGRALFGCEHYLTHKAKKAKRLESGYHIIRLTQTDLGRECKVWPRSLERRGSKSYSYGRDPVYTLDADGSFLLYHHELQSTKLTRKLTEADYPSPILDPEQEIDLKVIKERRRLLLSDPDYVRMEKIEKKVKRLWKTEHKGPQWQAYHDYRHNYQVEDILYRLIPDYKSNILTEKDWFCLLASAWLHEIGMIIGLLPGDAKKLEEKKEEFIVSVRDEHHERASDYIEKARKKDFDLKEDDEYTVISKACFHHRIDENINRIDDNIRNYKSTLISAYLHLALLIHLDALEDDDTLFNILRTPGIPWETKFHWLKIKWIRRIEFLYDEMVIKIVFWGSEPDSTLANFLPDKIVEDMQEKFDRLRNHLIKGKSPLYTNIEYEVKESFGGRLAEEMELIRSNIELEELSSASEAYATILDTLSKFTSNNRKYDMITSYFKNIEKVAKLRPCHTLIASLKQDIEKVLKNTRIKPKTKMDRINTIVSNKIQERKSVKDQIKDHSKPYLSEIENILVYGFSTMVITALSSAPPQVKAHAVVYVAECRGKTQFNSINKMETNDGVNYMKEIKVIGFQRVVLIHDISVGNFMKRGEIKKVFFGANGIDRIKGSFGHTCGHSTIADLSKIYDIPVFVVADTSKIGKFEWDGALNRDIKWMPNHSKFDQIFNKNDLLNPREDEVERDKISLIITEKGPKFPFQIKDI